jgi:hypothetical protein
VQTVVEQLAESGDSGLWISGFSTPVSGNVTYNERIWMIRPKSVNGCRFELMEVFGGGDGQAIVAEAVSNLEQDWMSAIVVSP